MRDAGPLAPVLQGLLTKDPAARTTAAQARRQLTAVVEEQDLDAPPPSAHRARRTLRGGDVQRFDVADLLALASSSKAALSTVVREVSERRHQPPMSRRERRAAAKQRRYRFKRRWVVVPMVLLVLLVVLVLGALALLVTGVIELS